MRQFYTYIHCKPNGDPFYVGKGCGNRNRDFLHHRNQHHKNITLKYGSENIGVFTFPCATEQQAFSDEIQQIAQLRHAGYDLANMTNGGDGVSGLVHSELSRAKMSASGIGKVRSEETRSRISAGSFGKSKTRGNSGNKHSEETKSRIAAAMTGRRHTAETKARMSLKKLGNTNRLCKSVNQPHHKE